MRLRLRYLFGAFLAFWAISIIIYVRKISLEKLENYEAGLLLTLETNLCSKTKDFNFTSSLGNNLENLKRFSYLVKQRTDELLLSSDAKDKNGIALKLLDSVFVFVAVESGKYPQLNRPSHSHELLESSVSIQRRLYSLQYPVNCRTAAKINCNVFKNCGIGCQIHHLVYCLSVRLV